MCEVHPITKHVIRILKRVGEALFMPPEKTAEWAKIEAERDIKQQLLAAQNRECPYCGKPINMSAHLHEKVFRSKGGMPGLDNSVVLCSECHIGKKGEHKNRRPYWEKFQRR